MALEIKFAFVCQRTFEELAGESEVRRYCNQCQFEVTNLAALNDRERLELFELVAQSGERICVSAPMPNELVQPCPSFTSLPPIVPLAGIPIRPSQEQLIRERKRLDQDGL